jgi:EpsD family peptidyl-prolyl cis-trans isomerase
MAACGPAHATDKMAKSVDRVLATVNGVEITQREVDVVFDRAAAKDASPQAADLRRRTILADLVRAEAMAQWAAEKGIEAPGQVAAEAAVVRRQLLAARAERAAQQDLPRVDAQSLQGLVANNPLLFAQRRLYTLEEVQIAGANGTVFARLDALVTREAADLDRAQREAMEAGATTERKVISISSEFLPKPVMEALTVARPGQLFVVQNGPDRGWVLAVRAAVPAPLVGEQALRVAASMAAEQQRRAAAAARTQEAVSRARIVYADEVLAAAPAASAPAPAPVLAADTGLGPAPARRALGVQPDAAVPDLPQGRVGYSRAAKLKMAAAGTGAVLAGTLAVWAVFALVRFGYGRFWLPRLWPLRPPERTPRLLQIIGKAFLRPRTLTALQRSMLWLLGIGFFGSALGLGSAFVAASRHAPGWALVLYAGLGWVLGILALYGLARTPLRQASPKWQGLTALGTQGMVWSLAVSARWL